MMYGRRSTDKIPMYKFMVDGSDSLIIPTRERAIEEAIEFILNDCDIQMKVVYMSMDEHDKLPEHKGY